MLFLIVQIAAAQLATVYVDATNGSDMFTGANSSDMPSGTGPKATIHAGLSALANQGRLIIFAGTYAGDGVDTDGSVSTSTDNADININPTTYPRLTTGLTIELRSVNGSNEVKILADANTIRAPNGALISHSAYQYVPNFVFSLPNGSLVITTTTGTEFLTLAGRDSSGSIVAGIRLLSGTVDIARSSSFRLSSGATISIFGSARFSREAPAKALQTAVAYGGGGTTIAGPETAAQAVGTGLITVNKESGSTITFPSSLHLAGQGDGLRILSGNAMFDGGVTLGNPGTLSGGAQTADLIITTNGSVVFNNDLNLIVSGGRAHDSTVSGIQNNGNGSVTFRKSVTWNAAATSNDASIPASQTTALVWNAGSGSIVFEAGMTLTHAGTRSSSPTLVEVAVQNNGTGSLKFSAPVNVIPRILGAETQRFSVAAINAGSGTLEISGELGWKLVNGLGTTTRGVVNITGATRLGALGVSTGTLVNAREGIINIGMNTLTLEGNSAHTLNGSYVTSTTGGLQVTAAGTVTIDGGSLPRLTIQQPVGGSTNITNGGSFVGLTVSSGELTMQSSVSVTEGIEVKGGSLVLADKADIVLLARYFRQEGGLVNLGGNAGGTLRLYGDFVRISGPFNAGAGSAVQLVGAFSQTIDPGDALQLSNLEINNSGGVVRVAKTLKASRNATIHAGARLDLGSASIVLNGDAGIFTNNGTFDAAGAGIVLGGANTISGGTAIANAEIRAGSGSKFSSITIDIGTGNNCTLKASEAVLWSGSMTILSGSLTLAPGVVLAPADPRAKLVIDVVRSKGITPSGGSFNPFKTHYSMRLTGTLLADVTMSPDLVAELVNVDTLEIDVNSDTFDGDGNLLTGPIRYFQFPGGVFVFGGSLVVGSSAAARLEGNGQGGNSFELSSATGSHVVRGILTTADAGDMLVASGERASLIGGSSPRDVSLVGNLSVSSRVLCRISGIRGFIGSLTALPGSSISMSMSSAPTDQILAGPLTLNGSQFTLESDIQVQAGVAFNAGVLDFGLYNLELTRTGDFLQGANSSGYATRGGFLIMNRPNARLRIASTEELGIPNLKILSRTSLDTIGRVTRNLVIGSVTSSGIPEFVLGREGNDLVFTGTSITLLSNGSGNRRAITADGTTNGTPGGRLFIAGTSVSIILSGDFDIEELVYNPPAINGTLTLLSSDLNPHELTISDIFTHAGGQIGLGINHMALTGTGLKPGCRAYNRSDGTLGASTGEFRFRGQAAQEFACGVGSSVPNFRIWNKFGVTKSLGSAPIIITKLLDLSDGPFKFEDNSVIIENDATVIRRRSSATISRPLSYRTSADISYVVDSDNGTLRTSIELPAELAVVRELTVSNPHPHPDSSTVLLTQNLGVRGRITLKSGRLDVGLTTLTLAHGGTLEVSGGRMQISPDGPGKFVVTMYNLSYAKTAVVNPATPEFQSGPAISVNQLSVIGSNASDPTIVRLYANRSVGRLLVDAPNGGIEFGAPGSFVARNLTIRDSVTIRAGAFSNTSGTNAIVTLAGTARQALTVPDSGLTLPGGASAIHLQLNNPAGVVLVGGDLRFGSGSILFFVNGVLDARERTITLSQTTTSPGFDRQNMTGSNISHVVGKVRQSITGGAGDPDVYPNGRYEFPIGTPTSYRPLVLNFTSTYPARNPGTVEVTHISDSPPGVAGLSIDGGPGVRIGGTGPFYWHLNLVGNVLSGGQLFDLEARVHTPGFRFSDVSEARLIEWAGQSPSSWVLLGSASGYGSNTLTFSPRGDSIMTVRAQSVSQQLLGSVLVTVGIPTDRRPYLLFRSPQTVSQVAVNVPTTFKVSVADPDNKPLTVEWKVNGRMIQTGLDTSFTHVFQSPILTQSVRAVYRNSDGFADSTEWSFAVVGILAERGGVPLRTTLSQNYPNPFNPSTSIEFEIAVRAYVMIKIYDVLGVEASVLVNDIKAPGRYSVNWNAHGLPSGTYFCRLVATELGGQKDQIHVRMTRMALTK
jgi:hypothetical protein